MVRPPPAFTLGSLSGHVVLLGLAHRTQVEGWSKKVADLGGGLDTDKICKEVFGLIAYFVS